MNNWHYVYVSSDHFQEQNVHNKASNFHFERVCPESSSGLERRYEVALLEVELTGDGGSANGFFVVCDDVDESSKVGKLYLPILRRVWFPTPAPGCDTSAMPRRVTFQDPRYMPFYNKELTHFRLVDEKGNLLQLSETSRLSLLLHVR